MQTVPRLIDQFIPDNYKLSLSINRQKRLFGGVVTIFGISKSDNKTITLHSKDLTIESIIFDGKKADFSFGDNDALIITHKDMAKGKHVIVISYNGKIDDSMHGIYPCYYEHNGIKKELIATQFESHHAREVIPCIDEPAAKATFDVTLTTEKDVIILGNMPVKTQNIENDQLVTTFNPTPVMSTYLLAWVIGELHKKTAFTKSGVEVNVWATPAQSADSLDFALDIATRSIDFFDEYFGIAYPLPKCDHVALPDFSSGAMENWGLITYREIALLADPKITSIDTKHYIASVIAHELSHQWFGNLVTMQWWNDLWLNESFATLVEYIAVDALEPSWNIWLDFASFESISALKRDSLAGVQSVQMDVNHPDEISTLFDGAIVYAKGAKLLQMLRNYIGETTFKDGLKYYFQTYAYKNTVANDLWSSFNKLCNKDIETLMTKWISQPGFPVLHASKNGNQIRLAQNRLVCKLSSPSDSLWPITLNSNCINMPEILDNSKITVNCNENSSIRFNIGNYAHFVTHYDASLLNKIILQLKNGELSAIDRLQILNEQNILATAGIINSAELVNLLASYKNETAEPVWNIISLIIGDLKKFVQTDEKSESNLRTFVGELAKKQYIRLGWKAKINEPETDTKLRRIILSLMLYSENPSVISTVIKMFQNSSVEKLDPELRSIIITAEVRHENNLSTIDSLIKTYEKTDSAELKQSICGALTSTRNPKIISKLISLLKNTSVIRTQDTARWIIYLMQNKYSRNITWKWLRDNWDWINLVFSGDKSYDDFPRYASAILSTNKQLKEYKNIFEPMLINPALTRVIEMGINEITNRIGLIKSDSKAVRKALSNL